MPGSVFKEHVIVDIGAEEPWPSDVKLFQPYEVEQILLPDNANCLAVQAYLRMCGLNYEVVLRSNCEYMSPSGKVPFIKCGGLLVAELDHIISFVEGKGITLTENLNGDDRGNMRAYMSLINTVLSAAELYICWCEQKTLKEVTLPRNGSVYPWPLNHIVNWQKRSKVLKKLSVLGWTNKSLDKVYEEVETCCKVLSERLGDKPYYFGDSPTELDAVVFGHVFSILTTPLPNNKFAAILRGYSNIIELCKLIENKYFKRISE